MCVGDGIDGGVGGEVYIDIDVEVWIGGSIGFGL